MEGNTSIEMQCMIVACICFVDDVRQDSIVVKRMRGRRVDLCIVLERLLLGVECVVRIVLQESLGRVQHE